METSESDKVRQENNGIGEAVRLTCVAVSQLHLLIKGHVSCASSANHSLVEYRTQGLATCLPSLYLTPPTS